MRRRYLLGLLLLSGFSGIAYELLWVRLLALNMGSTTLSFATVLSVFFAGLAMGSRWAGRRVGAETQPVRRYAQLELATGVLGLALFPLMKHSGVALTFLPAEVGPGALVARFLISAVLLLPPTLLMGATLPFVCLAVIEQDDETGRGSALIYGLNTLGAFLGAYFVTYWLLPNLGVFSSTLVAALVNFLVAGIAFVRARADDGRASPPAVASVAAEPEVDARLVRLAGVIAVTCGFAATAAQVVWGRLFAINVGGTTYGVGSVLVAVLFGVGLGSVWAARVAKRSTDLVSSVGWVLVLLIVSCCGFGLAYSVFDFLNANVVAAKLSVPATNHLRLLTVFVTLVVTTTASGAALPLLVAVIERRASAAGTSLARVYSWNTAGCIAGSVVGGYVLLPQLGSNLTLYALALLLGAAAVAFLVLQSEGRRVRALVQVSLVVAAIGAYRQFDPKEFTYRVDAADFAATLRAHRAYAQQVTFLHEGDIATVSVRDFGDGVRGLALNGLGQGSLREYPPAYPFESALVAAMPWIHTERAETGLVIGAGAGGTVDALLQLGTQHLDVAELERGVLDAVDHLWGTRSPLLDPRVRVLLNDARNHLLVSSRRSPHRYDFITSMPAHPWVASALFTREFFLLAAENLKEDGVFSTWFGAGQMDDVAVEGLFGAFATAFPHFIAYWVPEAGAFYLVGSPKPLRLDAARAQRLPGHPVFAGHVNKPGASFFLARVTAASPEAGWVPAESAAVSTDDNALIEFHGGLRYQAPRRDLRYLPRRALTASQLANADADLLGAAVEAALGTKDGLLPFALPSPDARAMLSQWGEALPPALKTYVEGRLALADADRAKAKAKFDELGASPLGQRGHKFLAATELSDTERLARLEALEPRTVDVQALLTGAGRGEGKELAPGDDPLRPLFEVPATPLSAAAGAELLARLRQLRLARLTERCVRVAHEAGWSRVEQVCQRELPGIRALEGRAAVQRALKHGADGAYDKAASAFREAFEAGTLSDAQVMIALRTAQQARADGLVADLEYYLQLRGMDPAAIAGTRRYYQQLDTEPAKQGQGSKP